MTDFRHNRKVIYKILSLVLVVGWLYCISLIAVWNGYHFSQNVRKILIFMYGNLHVIGLFRGRVFENFQVVLLVMIIFFFFGCCYIRRPIQGESAVTFVTYSLWKETTLIGGLKMPFFLPFYYVLRISQKINRYKFHGFMFLIPRKPHVVRSGW